MKPFIEALYFKSPVFLQNMAVSLMGYKLYKERFNKSGGEMLKELTSLENATPEILNTYRDSAFVRLARHAIDSTIYYKNWARAQGLTINDIHSLADISLFPVIEKQFLRENARLFRSTASSLGSQFILGTSGTTGSPLTVFCDAHSRSRHYAFFSQLRERFGITAKSRRVTLFGRTVLSSDCAKPPFWRYDSINRNLLMSSYHLKYQNLDSYYQKLRDYQPDEIFAYPSSLDPIARYIIDNNLPPLTLKLVMTTAETLSNQQKVLFKKAFNAPVVNQYGCTEMAFFAQSVDDNPMSFHPAHGYIESRLSDDVLSTSGTGEIVATGFVNYSMPVIRYCMGDQITLSGFNAHGEQIASDLEGRTDDVIYRRDGSPVGRIGSAFKAGHGIVSAQLYQSSEGALELRLSTNAQYTEGSALNIIHALRSRIGEDLPITVTLMPNIPKQANGKQRSVISHFHPRM